MRYFSAKKIVLIAILGAFSYMLMLVKFPLPFMPPFMDFDLAGIPEIIGTFLMGPMAGILIISIKLLIKIATMGSQSMFTGEIQNFILSAAYILPAWLVYHKSQSKKAATWGMIAGTGVVTITACLTNVYFIIPFYTRLYGLSMDAIVAMTQAVNQYVDNVYMLIILGIIPFNLFKYGVTSLVVYLSLERLKVLFHKGEMSHGV